MQSIDAEETKVKKTKKLKHQVSRSLQQIEISKLN